MHYLAFVGGLAPTFAHVSCPIQMSLNCYTVDLFAGNLVERDIVIFIKRFIPLLNFLTAASSPMPVTCNSRPLNLNATPCSANVQPVEKCSCTSNEAENEAGNVQELTVLEQPACILHVLQQLEQPQQLARCALVSKSWKEAALVQALWTQHLSVWRAGGWLAQGAPDNMQLRWDHLLTWCCALKCIAFFETIENIVQSNAAP